MKKEKKNSLKYACSSNMALAAIEYDIVSIYDDLPMTMATTTTTHTQKEQQTKRDCNVRIDWHKKKNHFAYYDVSD